jgi:hypothetical protein
MVSPSLATAFVSYLNAMTLEITEVLNHLQKYLRFNHFEVPKGVHGFTDFKKYPYFGPPRPDFLPKFPFSLETRFADQDEMDYLDTPTRQPLGEIQMVFEEE